MVRKFLLLCLLTLCGIPSFSFGKEPLEALEEGINAGISMLDSPLYQDADQKKTQQMKLWEVTQQIFDFEEFSRRVLASCWHKFSPLQRREFVEAFSEFLGKFYLSKLQERYRGERVSYLSQKRINENRALVEVTVLWRDLKIPVKIWMIKGSGIWKAYDVSILGVSALKNYRVQFRSILRRESPEQVIERLKRKIAEIDKKP